MDGFGLRVLQTRVDGVAMFDGLFFVAGFFI